MNRPGAKLSTPGYKDRGENWFIIGQRHAIVVFLVGHADAAEAGFDPIHTVGCFVGEGV